MLKKLYFIPLLCFLLFTCSVYANKQQDILRCPSVEEVNTLQEGEQTLSVLSEKGEQFQFTGNIDEDESSFAGATLIDNAYTCFYKNTRYGFSIDITGSIGFTWTDVSSLTLKTDVPDGTIYNSWLWSSGSCTSMLSRDCSLLLP